MANRGDDLIGRPIFLVSFEIIERKQLDLFWIQVACFQWFLDGTLDAWDNIPQSIKIVDRFVIPAKGAAAWPNLFWPTHKTSQRKRKNKYTKIKSKSFLHMSTVWVFFLFFFRFFKWVVLISIIGFLTDAASLRRVKSDLADFSVSLPIVPPFFFYSTSHFLLPMSRALTFIIVKQCVPIIGTQRWHVAASVASHISKQKSLAPHSKWNRLCLHWAARMWGKQPPRLESRPIIHANTPWKLRGSFIVLYSAITSPIDIDTSGGECRYLLVQLHIHFTKQKENPKRI